MEINPTLHALEVPFKINVAPGIDIPRSVFVYFVLGEKIYLIDTGVAECEESIFEYIRMIGRDPHEVAGVLLTHSHPDHIGALSKINKRTWCRVACHASAKEWVEDIDKQFMARPVPGFYDLVSGSCTVDNTFSPDERIDISPEISLNVVFTPGHSPDSVSFFDEKRGVLISGDAVIKPDDIPVYESYRTAVKTIEMLSGLEIDALLPSWGGPAFKEDAQECLMHSLAYLNKIDKAVREVSGNKIPQDANKFCSKVLEKLSLPVKAANPIVTRALLSHIDTR